MNTSSATFYTTGWQLEVGAVATPFEYRSYADELAKCMRYFERQDSADEVYTYFGYGLTNNTTNGYFMVKFEVKKRAVPTVTSSAYTTFEFYDAGTRSPTSIIWATPSTTSVYASLPATCSSYNGALLRSANTNNAFIELDAEM